MASVHIGVRHDDDATVANFRSVKVLANAALQRLNQRANFLKAQHLVQARLLHIQQLSTQRQNGLQHVIAPTLGASTGGVTFNNEQLGALHIVA